MKLFYFLVLFCVNFLYCQSFKACSREFGLGIAKTSRNCKYINTKNPDEYAKMLKLEEGKDENNVKLYCCPASKAEEACINFGQPPKDLKDSLPSKSKSIAGVAEFPHFALLAYINENNGQLSFECGGSLISPNFVLTAAHCCENANRPPIIVRLGKTSIDIENELDFNDKVDVDIYNMIIHPEFRRGHKYNDIALIELEHSVKFSFNVWPACLVPDVKIRTNNTELIVVGYGKSKNNWLLKASVFETSLKKCTGDYIRAYNATKSKSQKKPLKGLLNGITDNFICAHNQRKIVDNCLPDDGSPLQFLSQDTFYAIGITTLQNSCNLKVPSLYTRVSNYIDWIEAIVWE